MPLAPAVLVYGPYALLPDDLKKLCAKILPRLRLIPELFHWFDVFGLQETGSGEQEYHNQLPVKDLWRCLVRGKPIQILLEMLSSTGASDWMQGTDAEDFFDDDSQREYISIIITTINALETQRVLSYGETFRADRFLQGNASEFIKVAAYLTS